MKQQTGKLDKKEKVTAFLFILPPLIGFTVFTLISLVISTVYSFTNFNPIKGAADFLGFGNYISLFTNDVYAKAFIDSIKNTLFLLLAVPFGIVIAIAIAGLMGSRSFKGGGFFRAVIYLPAVTSVVAVNYVWRYMFQDDYGIINSLLHVSIPWLSDDTLVKVAMIIKNIWGGLGTQVILLWRACRIYRTNITRRRTSTEPPAWKNFSKLPSLCSLPCSFIR